jgi:hypothetical protein
MPPPDGEEEHEALQYWKVSLGRLAAYPKRSYALALSNDCLCGLRSASSRLSGWD